MKTQERPPQPTFAMKGAQNLSQMKAPPTITERPAAEESDAQAAMMQRVQKFSAAGSSMSSVMKPFMHLVPDPITSHEQAERRATSSFVQ
mmetsp:Transcript_47630/g.62957  ORF Transcript_47630/g.62957 Transcript_47630/m.62957 type:complete len:90 (+) Transcript_47630:2678-2947(+)